MTLSVGEITAIGIGFGNIAAWAKLIYDARKNGKNGVGRPCALHTDIASRIATVEANKTELVRELGTLHAENREEHSQIFSEIKSLAVAVSTASEAARTAASAAATAATAAAVAAAAAGAQRRRAEELA